MSLHQATPDRSMAWVSTEELDWDALYADQLPRVYNYFRFRAGTDADGDRSGSICPHLSDGPYRRAICQRAANGDHHQRDGQRAADQVAELPRADTRRPLTARRRASPAGDTSPPRRLARACWMSMS